MLSGPIYKVDPFRAVYHLDALHRHVRCLEDGEQNGADDGVVLRAEKYVSSLDISYL